MTERSDVTFNWTDYDGTGNPRSIIVDLPSTEFPVQDLVDTARAEEAKLDNLMYKPLFVDTEGKADLGQGSFTDITATLFNCAVGFQAREISSQEGTVTQANGSRLIDSSATFVSAGIGQGHTIINWSDKSSCDVVAVISETELTTTGPAGGTNDTFALNDTYRIYPNDQCDMTGGNVIAEDTNGSQVTAIYKTNNTQLKQTSSASGTFQNQKSVDYASFGDQVTLDATYGVPLNGASPTSVLTGNKEFPVDNAVDAVLIAIARGFDKIAVRGNYTFTAGDNIDGYTIEGQNLTKTVIVCEPAASTIQCEFFECHLQGTLDGGSTVRQCLVTNLDYVNGFIHNSILSPGTITLGGNAAAFFIDCTSGSVGLGLPNLDMGGSGQSCVFRNYNGEVSLSNKTGSDECSIDMGSGLVYIDSTVTAGKVTVRGVCRVDNNSTGTANIDTVGVLAGTNTVLGEGFVILDETSDYSGATYPHGTLSQPINNMEDALLLAKRDKVKRIKVVGNCTIPATAALDGYSIEGETPFTTTLTFLAGVTTSNTKFSQCTLTGTLLGEVLIEHSVIAALSGLWGLLFQTSIGSTTITVAGDVSILSCYSTGLGVDFPLLNMGGGGNHLILRDWSGPIRIGDKTGPDEVCIDMLSGVCIFEPTVTNGNAAIRGDGKVVNNSTGSFTLTNDVASLANIATRVWSDIKALTVSKFLGVK